MKYLTILLYLLGSLVPAYASYCPHNEQYLEMMSSLKPANEKEKLSLTQKYSEELTAKHPSAAVICRTKDNKYFYCVACPH